MSPPLPGVPPVQRKLSYLHTTSTGVDQTCLVSGGAVAKGFVILPVFKSRHRMITTWAVSLTDFANGPINYPKHLRMDRSIEKEQNEKEKRTAIRSQRAIQLWQYKCACTLNFPVLPHHIAANHVLIKTSSIQKRSPSTSQVLCNCPFAQSMAD